MKKFTLMLILPLALVLLAPPLLAQDAGEEEYDIEAAIREVQKLLRESEALLVKALAPRGEGEGESAAEAGEKAREAIEKLLQQGQSTGEAAAGKMQEILENAPAGGGGGSGQKEQQPKPGEEEKAKEGEKELGERDPKNSAKEGDPKSGEKQEGDPQAANNKPPESEKDKAARPDPNQEWLGRLPSRIRQAYQNGEWDRIPEKWRKLIQEYTRKMADIESDR